MLRPCYHLYHSRLLWVCCLTIIGIVPSVAGQPSKTNTDILNQVLQIHRQRASQLNPIFVKYTVTMVETQDYVQSVKSKQGPSDAERMKGRIQAAEYAQKGNKFLSRRTSPGLEGSRPSWRGDWFWIYNGEASLSKSNREREYLLSKDSQSMWMLVQPLAITGETSLLSILEGWSIGNTPIEVLSAVERAEDSEKVLHLELRYLKTGWRDKIWLLPDREYTVRRYESFNAKGEPVDLSVTEAIHDVAGRPFPHKATNRHYMSGNRLGYTQVLNVLSVTTDPGDVPDQLFEVNIPPDSVVFDTDLNAVVRRTESAQSHLDEAISKLDPPSLWQRWWWVLLAAVGLVAAAVGFVVRGRRRRE